MQITDFSYLWYILTHIELFWVEMIFGIIISVVITPFLFRLLIWAEPKEELQNE